MQMLLVAIYIEDSIFIFSMCCINNELEHIANCIEGADRKINKQINNL